MNTQQAAFYLKSFIIYENLKYPVSEQIKTQNLQLVLARLLDSDNNGTVTVDELANFFIDIYDDPKTRMLINTAVKDVKID